MRKILLLLTVTFFCFHFKAQLVVDNSLTVEQLVRNIFAGSGVEISNITFNGISANFADQQLGSFLSNETNLGLSGGIIIGTGDVKVAEGPNDEPFAAEGGSTITTFDSDLNSFSSNVLYHLAVLEFDFVPLGDTISLNYVFASEEYNEFVCSRFNDVFGFFVSGPGINGPYSNGAQNIAVIPGTSTAVAINTVNLGIRGSLGADQNCDNIDPNWRNYSVYFNNNTENFIQYDGMTTVLNAFTPVQCGGNYHLKIAIADGGGDGARDSGIFLEAQSLSSKSTEKIFSIWAKDNDIYEDCSSTELIFTRPSSAVFEALNLEIFVSGNAISGFDYNTIPNPIVFGVGVDSVIVPIFALNDHLNEGSETLIIKANKISECGDTLEIINNLTIHDALQIDSLIKNASLTCLNSGAASVFTSNSSGSINYSWNGPGSSGPQIGTTASIQNLSPGWYYTIVDDDFCIRNDSVFVDLLDSLEAMFSTSNVIGSAPVLLTFMNQSQNGDSFEWIFGNGLDTTVNTLADQSSLYSENKNYTVTLIAHQQVCSDTATFTFELIPKPSVHEANIFTPNGDDINPNFTLNPINFATFDYSIFNRWGNLMFQGDLSSPNWNGKLEDKEAEEGVYFYKYSGVGINGELKTGQGFFHLKK